MARRKLVQWCRRLEPKVARQFERPWLRWAGPWLTRHDALAFRRRPLAVGVSVGMLSGLIPGPAKAVVALLLCSMLRGNAIGENAFFGNFWLDRRCQLEGLLRVLCGGQSQLCHS